MSRPRYLEKKMMMADVEPGEKTGIYYMPICNLPFGTSWQDFKDWLRVDCDVEHVELFQSSTSGWIRLRGEDNFNKAWSRLKKEYFRNRAIIASDRNRKECIKIKEVVDSRMATFTTPVRWEVVAIPAHDPNAILWPASSYMPEAVLDGPDSLPHGLAHGGITASGHIFAYAPALGYYGPSHPGTSGLMPVAHFGNRYLSPHQCYLSIPYGNTPGTPIHAAPIVASFPQQGPCMAAETWKVVITSIKYEARPSEVSSWIRHEIGEYSQAIMDMEIPVAEATGRLRGHAHVTLSNSVAAGGTARILDQKLFRGRVVSARLLAADLNAESQRSKPTKEAGGARRNLGTPKPPKRRTPHASHPVRMEEAASDRRLVETNDPVVAYGSSTRLVNL
ncbi:hypothetical protein E4U21_004226 [Claviceps maximensis]|nr:hypothetical protein E4U21_004226 [Claviceps maximensis]